MNKPHVPDGSRSPYELLIIGAGPAGQKAAIQAAKLRKRVAIVEDREAVGGGCVHTGTIPSKAFREAVLHLSGFRQRLLYGPSYRVKSTITMEDLSFHSRRIAEAEIEMINFQLQRNHVEVIRGHANFIDSHTIEVTHAERKSRLHAERFLVATGAHPCKPDHFEFDGVHVLSSDDILRIPKIPRALTVIGGGVIGLEYASMFAALQVPVTVVDGRARLLEFFDKEIIDALVFRLRSLGVMFRLGEVVESCRVRGENDVETRLQSGKVILSDCVLVSAGRVSASAGMGLESIGVKLEAQGRIAVNKSFETTVPNIYAAGDVIGFPALASTSAEQGRLACCHAFGVPQEETEVPLPYGIYAIPEIGVVGKSEEELTKQSIPYEVGTARYSESARGHLIGDQDGLLKILAHRETGEILGVHAVGEQATELIHIGQAILYYRGTLDYLLRAVFNYPSLAGCYKIAALSIYNKIHRASEGMG